MRFVVTGSQGMLGTDMLEVLSGRNVVALSRNELDVTNFDAVSDLVQEGDIIINCAGYTKVDDAEFREDEAYAGNALAVKNLAIAARENGAKLVTFSTDYVFEGQGSTPYLESERRNAISAYGRSKAAGEVFAIAEHPLGSYIIRTAWLYGKNGANFPQTMLNLAKEKHSWAVVDDQRGQPTWTRDLANQVVRLIESDAPAGVYHGTNAGETTWFDFARAVLQEAGIDETRVTPTDSSTIARPAPRPAYSVLSHGRWGAVGIEPMRSWRDALHAAFEASVFEIPETNP